MTTTAIETASCYLVRIADGSIVRSADADDFARPLRVPAGCVLVDAEAVRGGLVSAVEIDQADYMTGGERGHDWGRGRACEAASFGSLPSALAAIRRTGCPARWIRALVDAANWDVIGVNADGVLCEGPRSRQTIAIGWEELRAAASQQDEYRAGAYRRVLAIAERMARR